MGRREVLRALAAKLGVAEVVGDDEDDVGLGPEGYRPSGPG